MKKTLLLLLFAVFAMGYYAKADSCDITINLADTGGGWESNQLSITYTNASSEEVTENFTIVEGYSATFVRSMQDGTSIVMSLNGPGSTTLRIRSFNMMFSNGMILYDCHRLESGFNAEIEHLHCADATRPRVINLVPNISGAGELAGGGTNIDPLSSVTVTATPGDNYLFNNWSINGEVVSTESSYTFTVYNDYDIQANFREISGIYVGDKSNTVSTDIPNSIFYYYSASQQIYDGLSAGQIVEIELFNGSYEMDRYIEVYLKATDKTVFENASDWISVDDGDVYFADYIAFYQGEWTTITLNNPFELSEGDNLAVMIVDYSGESTDDEEIQQECRAYTTSGNQTLSLLDWSDIDPTAPADGNLLNVKNQMIFNYSSYTITATSSDLSYGTITIDGNNTSSATYNSGETCTLAATPNSGYEFVGWKEGGNIVSTDATYSFDVIRNRTLVAEFEQETITDHYVPVTNDVENSMILIGEVFVNGVLQNSGILELGAYINGVCRGHYYLTTHPLTGNYGFQMNIAGDSSMENLPIDFYLYDHVNHIEYDNCTAVQKYQDGKTIGLFEGFQPITFVTNLNISATVNPDNSGTITGAGAYLYGTPATLTATPNEGYVFVNWTKNNVEVSTNPSYTFNVLEAAEYVANFNIVISATANPTAGGTVTGAGNYAYGATCQLAATNNSGYEFVNWTKGGVVVSPEPNFSFTVEAPGAYVANYNPIEFEINAIVNPAEAGIVSGAGMYMVGTNCTLTATANPGYEFVNWTKDNVEITTNSSLSFTVEGAATYYANFTGKQVTQLVNGWNWWSTAIQTDANSLETLETSLGHNGKTIKTQVPATINYYHSPTYSGTTDFWFGDLENVGINNSTSYAIEVVGDCASTMIGEYVDPEMPITINYNWNWIGYPVRTQQTIEDAISSSFVPTNNDIIKAKNNDPSLEDVAIYYETANFVGWFPSTFVFRPGQGYKYKSGDNNEKSLSFVDNGNSKAAMGESYYWKSNVNAFADNMVVVAKAYVADEEQYNGELELGAFVNGECRGKAHLKYFEPLNQYVALMSVAGEKGDVVEFGLVNASRNQISLDCSDIVVFESDAVVGSLDEPFEVHFSAMQEFSRSQLEMFPNPVSRNETVSFNLPDDEMVKEVVVTNAVGAVVKHNASSLTMIGEGMPMSGVYMVKVICNSGNVYIGKLIVK